MNIIQSIIKIISFVVTVHKLYQSIKLVIFEDAQTKKHSLMLSSILNALNRLILLPLK